MLKYVNNSLIIIDVDEFNNKLKFSVKHFNKLPNNNIYILQIIKKFNNEYTYRYIMSKLKVFYWTKCETINKLEQLLKQKLEKDISFEDFFI